MAQPTAVRLANGQTYTIPPAGDFGTFAWARQASLVAVAYKQIGNLEAAAQWDIEWNRRAAIWSALEAGRDRAEVLQQFGADLLAAPFRIAATVGQAAIDVADKAKDATFKLADLVSSPWFWAGAGLVVIAVALALSPVGPRLVKRVTGV